MLKWNKMNDPKKPGWLAVFLVLLLFSAVSFCQSLYALPYGSGTYGSCEYSSCSIFVTSSGTVDLDVTPTSSGVYSVASDAVTVETSSSTGYQLSLKDTDTNTDLADGTNSIPTSSGTLASPIVLALNTWGYRVDGTGGFGVGPTSEQNSVASNSYTFGGMPASISSADIIRTTASAASAGETTTVWFGVRLDTTKPAGQYTNQVTYTAVVN